MHRLAAMWLGTAAILALSFGCASAPDPAAQLPRPTPEQAAWQDLELGTFIHFDIMDGKKNPEDFNPTQLDTDQWVQAAKAMGAKYAVLTTQHASGFLLWQSDAYPFGVRQAAKWRNGKGDVVRDFVNSCRKAGIKPGLYTHLLWNPTLGVVGGKVNWGKGDDPVKQRQYAATCEKMMTELWSNYGDLAEIWFDGQPLSPEEGGPDILPLVRKLQPNAAYRLGPASTIRWGGNESGTAGYPCWSTVPSREYVMRDKFLVHGDPNGKVWLPAEADCPLPFRKWRWIPNQSDKDPVPSLMQIYYKSVGRNSNLLLNIAPNLDGLVPAADMKYYEEFGREIHRRFDKPIAETSGTGPTLELYFADPKETIDHVILMEDITQGERVREYVVEAIIDGKWKTVCEGLSIGHKHIQKFPEVNVCAIRLRVTSSVGTPHIRSLAVYRVGPTTDENYVMPYE